MEGNKKKKKTKSNYIDNTNYFFLFRLQYELTICEFST